MRRTGGLRRIALSVAVTAGAAAAGTLAIASFGATSSATTPFTKAPNSTSAVVYLDAVHGTKATGCGGERADACVTLAQGVAASDALFKAGRTDVAIDIAAGLYKGAAMSARMTGADSLSLIGAGAATTVLDGEHTGRILRIRDLTGGHTQLAVTGLTFNGGGVAGKYYDGGAIDVGSTDVTVSGSAFTNNIGAGDGGAIDSVGGTIDIRDSVFTGNTATRGGAVSTLAGAVTIEGSRLSGNTATGAGGAVNGNLGTVAISGSTLQADTAAEGGAIYLRGTSSRNVSGHVGVLVAGSTFAADVASGAGSAIATAVAPVLAIDSTFAGGSAGTAHPGTATFGATIASASGSLAIVQSTLAGTVHGGVRSDSGTTTMTGSLLADARCAGRTVDDGGNLVGDTSCPINGAGSIRTTHPGLAAALAANAPGEPQTLALAIDSPARNIVHYPGCQHIDQRGVSRAGWQCDAGAYEYSAGSQLLVRESYTAAPAAAVLDGGRTVAVGAALTFTVVLRNTSTFTQPNNATPEFSQNLPKGMQPVRGSAGVTISGHHVVWNGAVAGLSQVTFSFTATVRHTLAGHTVSTVGIAHYDALGTNLNAAERHSATQRISITGPDVEAASSSRESSTPLADTGTRSGSALGLAGLLLAGGGALLAAGRRRRPARHRRA